VLPAERDLGQGARQRRFSRTQHATSSLPQVSLEVITGFSSNFLMLFLNPLLCLGDKTTSCLSSVLNRLLEPISGRLAMVTGPPSDALPEDVRTEAVCDFGDGAIMDNTGVACTLAAAPRIRSIVATVTPEMPFRPPPLALLDQISREIDGLGPATARSLSRVQQIVQGRLRPYLDEHGAPAIDWPLAALFGVFGAQAGGDKTSARNPFGVSLTVTNQVFDSYQLVELMKKLGGLYNEGRPLIVTLEGLHVLDNPFFGTRAFHADGTRNTVDLTVIYYSLPGLHGEYELNADGSLATWVEDDAFIAGSWAARVDPALLERAGGRKFPHLATFGENLSCARGCRIDAFTNEQVNLFAYLGDFMVQDAWEGTLEPIFRDQVVRTGPGWKPPAVPTDRLPVRPLLPPLPPARRETHTVATM